jgi:hypothetical protein
MAQQVETDAVSGHHNEFVRSNANGLDVSRLLAAMRAECNSTIAAWDEAAGAELLRRLEETSSATPPHDNDWWEELPQPLGGCFRDYDEADYLSAQALLAATCIADELAFGGTEPSEDATRNLTGEILFHATWASWDDETRRAQCQPIKSRGFDAAEELGIAAVRTWNDQLAGAGAERRFDDYAMVLDFLDVCEKY